MNYETDRDLGLTLTISHPGVTSLDVLVIEDIVISHGSFDVL